MPHALYIPFVFLFGACIGSFLNVVVWRLPRGESLSTPPSHCPKCGNRLKWYDNVPILGWIKLRGRCRFCREPISVRYPVVEAVTALLFVFYYVMYYVADFGPCAPVAQPMFAGAAAPYRPPPASIFLLHLFLVSALLAASLIDAELFLIPPQIPGLMAVVGVLCHTFLDEPGVPGALNLVSPGSGPSPAAALAAGGTVGLAISLLLRYTNKLPLSFPEGEPSLEVDKEMAAEAEQRAAAAASAGKKGKHKAPPDADDDLPPPPQYTPAEIRREIRKEMLFLLPPMALGILWFVLTTRVPGLRAWWDAAARQDWLSGMLGALFGGLIGGFVVWITRILGTIGFGRVAMGLGDVDLMFGVGCVIGAGAVTVAFFVAPFFGIALALYMLLGGTKRELPYGPYLSLASGFVMLFYCPIADWLAPGLAGLGYGLQSLVGGAAQ